MDDATRLVEVERRVDYIIRMLSNFTFSAAITELSRRMTALEERFDESSFNMDNSIRNVYIKQEELFRRMWEEEEERKRKEERMRREPEFRKMAEDTFDYIAKDGDRENIFRVKDKNITEISSDCLYGLSLLLKKYDKTSLDSCFYGCEKLTRLEFPPDFDTSNVTDMSSMFRRCKRLSTLDLSSFNTYNVRDMNHMFVNAVVLVHYIYQDLIQVM